MIGAATTDRLDPGFLADFSHRWLEAWNDHDGDRVAALCTRDVQFTDPGLGTVHGRPAVAFDPMAAAANEDRDPARSITSAPSRT